MSEDLEKRISNAKKKLLKPKKKALDSSAGVSLIADLISGVAVGGFLGYIIDHQFDTTPLFLIIMVLLGAVGGFYIFYKQLLGDK